MLRALFIPLMLLTLSITSAVWTGDDPAFSWEDDHAALTIAVEAIDFGWDFDEPVLIEAERLACACPHTSIMHRHDSEALRAITREQDLDFYWLQPGSIVLTYPVS